MPNKIGAFIEALRVDNPRDTGSSETKSLTQRNKGVRVLKKERGNLPKLFGQKRDWWWCRSSSTNPYAVLC